MGSNQLGPIGAMGSIVFMPVNSSHFEAAADTQWRTHLPPCEVYHSNQAWWLQRSGWLFQSAVYAKEKL